MSNSRYPKQCYEMLLKHDESGRTNWASRVRCLLCKHGFGYVWALQFVGDAKHFISLFKCRLVDNFRQSWHDSLSHLPDFSGYFEYHPDLIISNYISQLSAYEHRRAICLLRCNRLPLRGVPRFGKVAQNPYCKECEGSQIEDACHFLFVCPRYTSVRNRLIPSFYARFPSPLKVQLVASDRNSKLSFKIALYICECLRIRNDEWLNESTIISFFFCYIRCPCWNYLVFWIIFWSVFSVTVLTKLIHPYLIMEGVQQLTLSCIDLFVVLMGRMAYIYWNKPFEFNTIQINYYTKKGTTIEHIGIKVDER